MKFSKNQDWSLSDLHWEREWPPKWTALVNTLAETVTLIFVKALSICSYKKISMLLAHKSNRVLWPTISWAPTCLGERGQKTRLDRGLVFNTPDLGHLIHHRKEPLLWSFRVTFLISSMLHHIQLFSFPSFYIKDKSNPEDQSSWDSFKNMTPELSIVPGEQKDRMELHNKNWDSSSANTPDSSEGDFQTEVWGVSEVRPLTDTRRRHTCRHDELLKGYT